MSSTEFGAFNLAFTAYLLSLGISRALTTEPLAVRYSTCSTEEWRSGVSAAAGTATIVGTVSGAGCLIFALLSDGPAADAFLGLGFVMPGLLLQDCWRLGFFPAGTGRLAFVNDLVWALVLFPSLAVVLLAGERVLLWGTFVWGASASLAAFVGAIQAGARPRIASVSRWWVAHRDLASRFVAHSVVYSSAGQFMYWGIAVVAGLAAVGALRAGLILLGPLNMVFTGLGLVAVPEGARMLLDGTDRLRRLARKLSALLGVIALLWALVAYFIPSDIGTSLLGDSWEPGRDLLVPLSLMTICIGLGGGALSGLQALGAANEILAAGIAVALLNLVGGLGGAAAAGPFGAAWGLAVANAGGAAAVWLAFHVAANRNDSEPAREITPSEPSVPPVW